MPYFPLIIIPEHRPMAAENHYSDGACAFPPVEGYECPTTSLKPDPNGDYLHVPIHDEYLTTSLLRRDPTAPLPKPPPEADLKK